MWNQLSPVPNPHTPRRPSPHRWDPRRAEIQPTARRLLRLGARSVLIAGFSVLVWGPLFPAGGTGALADGTPTDQLGPGGGSPVPPVAGGCGNFLLNADGEYETAYSWQYGGTAPPDYGAFAESYSGQVNVCAITLDFSQNGGQVNQTLDAYVWEDAGGEPGVVVAGAFGVDPGDVEFWPAFSRHVIPIEAIPTGDTWWVGTWSDWPDGVAGWFIGADLDGPGGTPMTRISPESGYPPGWADVSVVWGPTQAMGIGVEFVTGSIGACCFEDGVCLIRSAEDCAGSYLGDGVRCDPNPCPQPPEGACCLEDGTCRLENVFLCEDIGGIYLDDGTQCDPNPCPQPPTGACCLFGRCLELDPFDCAESGGVWIGEISCDDFECPPILCQGPQPSRGGENYVPPLPSGDSGPNAGGTLILHFNEDIQFTSIGDDFCGQSELVNCWDAVTSVYVDVPVVFHALAAFDVEAAPRLAGVSFGIEYPPCIHVEGTGHCGDFSIETAAWPAAGEGVAVAWNTAQTSAVTEVFWFVAYVDPGEAGILDLIPNPVQGAFFADDDVPSNLDPIAGLGAMGFRLSGFTPCPSGTGACCTPVGECILITEEDCVRIEGEYLGEGATCTPTACLLSSTGSCCFVDDCLLLTQGACEGSGGVWYGNDTGCDPNPCQATPTIPTSWGRIKSQFR